MTLKAQIDYIKNTLSTGLPALLSTAGLDNFASYNSGRELKSQSIELCIYPDTDSFLTDSKKVGFIIKAQLYGVDKSVEYFDVIKPFILENINPEALGFTILDSLVADFYPADLKGSSYVFFSLVFSAQLDDCDDY